jgi:protein-S-isoprenylcysteine O-methyltransferase Ste14
MRADDKTLREHVGLKRFVHDIVHERQRFRQFLGIALLILVVIVGAPTHQPLYYAGATIAALGILVRLWASGHVKKNKVLATSGPYGFVRHPLYVGNHLIMFGYCLASELWWSFVAYLAFSLYFYPQTIRQEDEKLARLFPEEWQHWAAGTRALIPRLTPYRSAQTAEWSFAQSLRQNGEPVIAALLVLGLYILYQPLRA